MYEIVAKKDGKDIPFLIEDILSYDYSDKGQFLSFSFDPTKPKFISSLIGSGLLATATSVHIGVNSLSEGDIALDSAIQLYGRKVQKDEETSIELLYELNEGPSENNMQPLLQLIFP